MPEVRTTAVEVFCAYAHEDETWLKRLEKHLSVLKRQGLISLWNDRKLVAGSEWKSELDTHLEEAAMILLLISADFLASDYCYGVEMQRALGRHDAHEARVIPILLRPCDWPSSPFAGLNALPAHAKPITCWNDWDEALTEVATGIRLALEDLSLLSARLPHSGRPRLWNVPFARNPFFTEREQELAYLQMHMQQNNAAAIGQMQAISGLGGIGKTQLAVEYTYRSRTDYQALFWVRAESLETLNASYAEIAALLKLLEKDAQKQELVVQAVRSWLETHQGWLLILDNLDEPNVLFPSDADSQPRQPSPFLPLTPDGHLLVTTRATDLSALALGLAHPLVVETFTPEQGARLLLQRAGLLALDADLTQAAPQDLALAAQLSRELGGLPLALNQAGAYLSATRTSLAAYLHLYQQRHTALLHQHRNDLYPETVTTTWTLSFKRVEERNPAAADLLRFCAFLAPDDIPEEIFAQGRPHLGDLLTSVVTDPIQFNEAIENLRAYSLVARDPHAQTLTVHRLVQTVLRDNLPIETHQQWIQRAVNTVSAAFPSPEFANWLTCERLLPHALFCATWIEQAQIETRETISLLNQIGRYLHERGRYAEAKPLLQRALALCEQHLGAEHSVTAQHLDNLAELSHDQGSYEQAEMLYQRALLIRQWILGTDHPETATSLNNLARLYQDRGNYKQAQTLYLQALVIRERSLGTDHSETATTLNHLAKLSYFLEKYEKAEPIFHRSLTIRLRTLGKDHPETATSLNNLARLYYRQKKYSEAETLLQEALDIRRRILGENHPATAVSKNNLAELFHTQGNNEQAETLHQHVLDIRLRMLGEKHTETATSLNNLAKLHRDRQEYESAELLFLRALDIRRRALGNHLDTAGCLNDLAELYRLQGRHREAEPLYRQALVIRQQVLGDAQS